MAEQTIEGTNPSEGALPSEGAFPLEEEYARTIVALSRTGVLAPLPRSGNPGVIGIDGKDYPVPTQEQVQELFARNHELVDRKARQGFTQLQLTPIAMPTPQLMDRVRTAVRNHAAAGQIIQTKQASTGADLPVRINTREPIWMWDTVRQALDTPHLVYFPQAYTKSNHQGLTKEEAMQTTRLCAVPGWSVGLIEPIRIMPQPGQGQVIGGRRQLEAYSAPRDYLGTLGTPPYQGETGWALEDFLVHFMSQLETTNQVSHDRYDGNALWLLGSYMPDSMPHALLVLTGFWARDAGRRLYLSAHRSANRFWGWVARSMVRLGA
jgi:hypothetical protein